MNSTLTHLLSRQVWPRGDLDILLGAILLAEDEAAGCWQKWKQRCDIENVTWEEHKLLARLAGRLASIDPDCPYRPRLEGLSKAHWTHSQLMLRASAKALDTLISNNIPVMLLKGGALHAASLSSQGPRITSDLDVLVPRKDFSRAVKLLYAAGWSSRSSVEFASTKWNSDTGINLHLKPHGDIDIHHQPVHGAIVAEDVLDGLWDRAEERDFHDRSVWVPSLADSLVFASAHAAHSQFQMKPSAAWIFDLAVLLRQSTLSSDKVVESAIAFKAELATLAMLLYLNHKTNDSDVERFVKALESNGSHWRRWLHFLWGSDRKSKGKRLRRLARYISSPTEIRDNYDVIPRAPLLSNVPLAFHEIAIGESSPADGPRHEITLPQSAAMSRRLVLELAFSPTKSTRPYQFDVSADDTPLARVSSGVITSESEMLTNFAATLPSSGPAIRRLVVQALAATNLLPSDASATQIHAARPVSFRIVRLTWD